VRRTWIGICLAAIVVAGGCSDGEMSMAEYVERFNDITEDARRQYDEFAASPQGGVLVAEGEQFSDFTPQDLQGGLERIGQIEREVLETAAAIEPPEQVAEFHSFYFALSPFTEAREALAARAGTAADWEELSATPEMASYRAAIAADKERCIDFAATIDATGDREVFGDMPWVPSELAEAVESVLGCEQYPERPEDLYRPPTS
jgi:hypothetical protein